jgi:hypothetical protein
MAAAAVTFGLGGARQPQGEQQSRHPAIGYGNAVFHQSCLGHPATLRAKAHYFFRLGL